MKRFPIGLVVGVAALMLAACTSGAESEPAPKGAVAVTMTSTGLDSFLTVIDLERGAVIRREGLRSACFDIDADVSARKVVTSQSGGLGSDGDRRAGIFDLATGKTRYVDLKVPNPTTVNVAGGKATLVHGLEQRQGYLTSVVDIQSGRLEKQTHTPVLADRMFTYRDKLASFASIGSPNSYRTSVMLPGPGDGAPIAGGEMLYVQGTDPPLVIGARSREASDRAIFELDGRGDVVREAPLEGMNHHAFSAVRFGDTIAVADADWLDPLDPGREVALFDARTFARTGTIRLNGSPSALAPWGDKLIVLDAYSGELLTFREGSIVPVRRVHLPDGQDMTGDVVVLP